MRRQALSALAPSDKKVRKNVGGARRRARKSPTPSGDSEEAVCRRQSAPQRDAAANDYRVSEGERKGTGGVGLCHTTGVAGGSRGRLDPTPCFVRVGASKTWWRS